jgi:acyl-CoA-binding protein
MYSSTRLSSAAGGRLLVAAIAVSILALVGLQFLRSPREGPGAQRYRELVSLQLLNGQLDDKRTEFTVETFVHNTRYEGRVRINLPPKREFVSIVFFNYSAQLPQYMKYQCFSYPQEEIIFCDARFLDSFPDAAPIQLSESGSPAPSLLFMWAVGHEIGHVVLRHSRPGILDLPGNSIYEAWHDWRGEQQRIPLKSLATLVSLGNIQENEADSFAIRQLRLNPTRALQMAMTLTDAALWLQGKYREEARSGHDAPILYVSRHAHPPLLMRILALSAEMEKTFVAYRSLPYIDDDMLFRIRTAPPRSAATPTLLFDGFYRHITDAGMSPEDLHDLALYAFFSYGPDDYEHIRESYCKPVDDESPRNALCIRWSRSDRQARAQSKPCDVANELALWGCVREHVTAFLPCLSPSDAPAHEQCPSDILADSVRQQLQQLDGHKFSGVAKQWTALSHAEIFIQSYTTEQKTDVSDNDYAEYLLERWGPALTRRFIERLISEYVRRHENDASE